MLEVDTQREKATGGPSPIFYLKENIMNMKEFNSKIEMHREAMICSGKSKNGVVFMKYNFIDSVYVVHNNEVGNHHKVSFDSKDEALEYFNEVTA